MKKTMLILLACLSCSAFTPDAVAQQIVYVVRHGERLDDSRDSPLSAAGEARAEVLAKALAMSGVKAIYTTPYRRTMQLAAPLARVLKTPPSVHPAGDTPGLISKIKSHGADEAVLVVGHSNTVPEILKGLGHSAEIRIAESEFDNLFVLVPRTPGPPVVAWLKY